MSSVFFRNVYKVVRLSSVSFDACRSYTYLQLSTVSGWEMRE